MSIVKSITIKNFKSLEDVTIKLSQLTFLFGANSSGKSSFLKALMFLSKNMLHNFNGLVNYQISKDINLIDYRNIVRDNNVENQISFEVGLKGIHYFPEYEFIENNNDRFGKVNLFKSLELSFKRFDSEDPCNYDKREFDVIYKAVFSFEGIHGTLKTIDILDLKTKSKLTYSEELLSYYSTQFILFGNEEISQVFNSHWELFDFDKLYGFDYVLSNEFNSTFDDKGNPKFVSELWNSKSDEEKKLLYYEFIRFYHFSGSYLTQALKNFFDMIHLGITREVPKSIYLLRERCFDEKEYYGFLNYIRNDNNSKDFKILKTYFSKVKELIEGEIESQIEVEKLSIHENFVGYVEGHKIASKRKWIAQNVLLNVNRLLIELGFELVVSVNMNQKLAQLNLIGESGFKCDIENASSGIIQVLPIILSTSIVVNKLLKGEFFNSRTTDNPELDDFLLGSYFNPIWADRKDHLQSINFQTILIEQPELHLHPKIQSDLAKIFADTVSIAAENASLFVETHSEHLIRKIQVLIAKGELDRDKVGVWYFKKVDGVTKVEQLEIDENGLFKKDWPDGFFDDSVDLTMELFEALRKRKN